MLEVEMELPARTIRGEKGAIGAQRRQHDTESRAAAQLTGDLDMEAHQSAKGLRDGEAQPGAAESSCGAGIGLLESVENHSQFVFRNANACVGDLNAQGAMVCWMSHNTNSDATPFGELQGVAYQINNHLPELFAIGFNRSDSLRDLGKECDRPLTDERLLLGDGFLNKDIESDGGQLKFDFMRFNLGKVQHVVNKSEEVAAIDLDSFEEIEVCGAHILRFIFEQDVGKADN